MIPQETLSLLLGYISIGFWLGAQFPQIVVNWRRKSVDGLSLPFLANWLLGDSANLIGCLLTNQLPFQTYLATYFVLIDSSLVIQHFYYDAPRATVSVLSSASSIIAPARNRSRASSLILSSPPSTSSRITPGDNLGKLSAIPSISPSRRRAKSFDPMSQGTVLSNVPSSTIMHSNRTATRVRTRTAEHALDQPISHEIRPRVEQELETDDDDIEPDSDMITSFYSEGGDRPSGRGKHVSWGRNSTSRDRDYSHIPRHRQRSGSLGFTTTRITEEQLSISPTTLRGRPTTPRRMTDSSIESEDDLADNFQNLGKPISAYDAVQFPSDSSDMNQVDSTPLTHSRSRSRVRRASSALSEATSRRSASIVFLGVMVLIGFSKLDYDYSPATARGNVLIPLETPYTYHSDLHITSLFPRNSPTATFIDNQTQQLIGRLAAWTCTTLYLTSRLPQIWKNYTRKSVEGLSMYLFAFAFFGNLFYVLSILTSPNMNLPPEQSRQFLRDSVPYLLGSGGTLLFDITIVSQSFIYTSPAKRDRKKRRRSRTLSSAMSGTRGLRRSLDDEERGLLQNDDGTVVGDRNN